jgi:hypothetical protein
MSVQTHGLRRSLEIKVEPFDPAAATDVGVDI